MKKAVLLWVLGLAVWMIAVPGAVAALTDSANFMPVILLVLFIGDPACFLVMGVFTGCGWRERWWLIPAGIVMFLIGIWLFIAPFNMDFLVYAAAYAVIGAVGTAAGMVYRKVKQKK